VRDPLIAELTYRETVAARERVRGIQRAITLPLRLLAIAELVGSAVVLLIGRFHLGSYFAPAYLAVLVASAWWYRRYATKNGLLLPVRPWMMILVATIASSACLSRLGVTVGKSWISDFGPCLAVAVGAAATAAWLRSRRLAVSAGGMVTAIALISVVARGDVAVSLQLAAIGILLWHASNGKR